jgi:hypothetical protein
VAKSDGVQIHFLTSAGYVLAFLGVASMITSFFPELGLWGIDTAGALKFGVSFVLVALLLVLAWPGISPAIGSLIAIFTDNASDALLKLLVVIFIALIFGLFIILRSENLLLGDGFIILGTLKDGAFVKATEPLGFIAHSAIASIFPGENPQYWAYAITSMLCGLAFMVGLFLWAKKASDFYAAVAVAGTFGVMQFFYGHVENYTIPFTLLFFFMLMGLRDLEKNRLSVTTLLLFGFAVCFHMIALAFAPSIIYLVWHRFRSRVAAGTSIVAFLVIPAISAVLIAIIGKEQLANAFVPLAGAGNNPYHLLSKAHLFDLLNIALLSFPLVLILPIALRLLSAPSRYFLLLAIIPALAFTLAISPHLGAIRDWDLLSFAAAPIMAVMIVSMAAISDSHARAKYGVIVSLAAFALLHSGSWILLNSDKYNSYEKLKSVIHNEMQYTADYMNGLRLKSWAYLVVDHYNDTTEAIRADEIRYLGEPNDAINTTRLARNYSERGRGPDAVRLVLGNWRNYLSSEESLLEMAKILLDNRRFFEAEQLYRAYLDQGYSYHVAFNNFGYCLALRNNIDSAFMFYEKALENLSEKPLGLELKFCGNCLQLNYSHYALRSVERMRNAVGPDRQKIVDQLAQSIESGKFSRADSLLRLLSQ